LGYSRAFCTNSSILAVKVFLFSSSMPGVDYAVFLAVGFISYNLFKNLITNSMGAFESNQVLFVYLQVSRRQNHAKYIRNIAYTLSIKDRVVITWDVHLPTFLRHVIGTIVINSTVGISSLYHHTPTICLSEAIYDLEGLTSKDLSIR
jgi:capsule polysaccharide modification protein KpsS